MRATSDVGSRRDETDNERHIHGKRWDDEQQVLVVEQPHIMGPFAVEGNPVSVRYEVVARLALPTQDAEVTPIVSFSQEARNTVLDVHWTTHEHGEPRGAWERSVTITVPRQFAVKECRVVGEIPPQEHVVGG